MSDYIAALKRVADTRQKMAERILKEKSTDPRKKFEQLFNLMIAGVEGQIELDLAESGIKPACHDGCHWCCCIRISCTPIEAIAVSIWVRQQHPELIPGLIEFTDAVKNVGVDRYWNRGAWCPFLAKGPTGGRHCGVYEARPMPCRAYLSLKANDCKTAARQLHKSKNEATVPYLNHILHANSAMMAGVAEACNLRGLDCTPVEFTQAVRIALQTPDIISRFMAGESLFDEARNPDTHLENIQRTIQEIKLYGDLLLAVPNTTGEVRRLSPLKAAGLIRNHQKA